MCSSLALLHSSNYTIPPCPCAQLYPSPTTPTPHGPSLPPIIPLPGWTPFPYPSPLVPPLPHPPLPSKGYWYLLITKTYLVAILMSRYQQLWNENCTIYKTIVVSSTFFQIRHFYHASHRYKQFKIINLQIYNVFNKTKKSTYSNCNNSNNKSNFIFKIQKDYNWHFVKYKFCRNKNVYYEYSFKAQMRARWISPGRWYLFPRAIIPRFKRARSPYLLHNNAFLQDLIWWLFFFLNLRQRIHWNGCA